ncbi:unannotated protein [freshwater metagenome]|uniref:Unannotated protein n=1 Tax=freshwater metagenome TaxID=449393 RepID=A0A6J7GDV4_9ZZZZ
MRLEHHHDPPPLARKCLTRDQRLRSGQHGPHLGGVMGVVVEHSDSVLASGELEPPVHSPESGQPGQQLLDPRAHLAGSHERRQGVEGGVPSRYSQPNRAGRVLTGDLQLRDAPDVLGLPGQQANGHLDGSGVDVGRPVAEHRHSGEILLDHAAGQSCRTRIVHACNQHTARVQQRGEIVEHLHVGLGRTEEIEMIGLDVRHDDHVRRVLQQRTVTLVRLGDEDVATAVMRVGSGLVELTADGERRVEPTVLQCDDQHRCGRRLAVRARHQQGAVPLHQRREDGGPQHHRNPAIASLDEFGVGLGYGRVGRHDHGGAAVDHVQRACIVPDSHQRTAGSQRQHPARFLGIRSGHLTTARQQNACDPGHPGTADSHHVHPFELCRQLRHRRTLSCHADVSLVLWHSRRRPVQRRAACAVSSTICATAAAAPL